MIDISTYRSRIGCYSPKKDNKSSFRNEQFHDDIDFCITNSIRVISGHFIFVRNIKFKTQGNVGVKIGLLYYLYYILFIILLSSNILLSEHFSSSSIEMFPSFISSYKNFGLPSASTIHVRLAYFVILSFHSFIPPWIEGGDENFRV